MKTTESFPARPARRPRFARGARGVSLVEVMIAATIFTVLAMSGTAFFIQNQRMSVAIRYRTQVTNTSLNILEQLRLKNYQELKTLWTAATAAPGATHNTIVIVSDPAYVPPNPDPFSSLNLPQGLRPLEIKINVLDDAVIDRTKTYLELPMDSEPRGEKLSTRYWLTLKHNQSNTSPIVEAFEIALIYEWRPPRQPTWQEGTIRLVVANPQAVKTSSSATP